MIAAAERYARDTWQARTLTLSVIHLRHELIRWYQRCGFTLTSERDEFPYGNPRFGLPKREDLWFVILRKDLSLS
jgi:ribosomal protein S18 acetylase RimI-like enzyme